MSDIKQTIIKTIEQNRDKLFALSGFLYEHPETALNEKLSAQYLCDFLESVGFGVERGIAGMETAFRAVKANKEGPRIAFIAEYDALSGLGHACGHHLISAMSVGAAMALAPHLSTYPGEISIIGTPGEELAEGKPRMLESGVFDGLSAAMMIHPSNETTVCPRSLCIRGLEFRFYGKSAHAGLSPYDGVNALDAVVLLYNAINALRQQLREDARVHGIILEAGNAVNCIPDKSRVRLEIRAAEHAYFNEVVKRVINCAKAASLATGCSLEYESYEPDCMCLVHDKRLTEAFYRAMDELSIGEDGNGIVSTDMGNVSFFVPSIHPMLKVVEGNEELHTKEFGEATLSEYAKERTITGAMLLALTGLDVLMNERQRHT